MEEHDDILMELVSSRYWTAVKREVAQTEHGLIARLMQPVASLPDIFLKEGNASRLAALRQLIADIEKRAETRAKQLRERDSPE